MAKHLTLFMALYTMTDKSAVLPRTEAGWNQRVSHVLMEPLLRRHYYEQLRPPKKWNYLYIHVEQGALPVHFDFRDKSTNEVAYQDRFDELCVGVKSQVREYLQGKNPAYDQKALEAGLADMNYDWFPKMNMLVLSTLLPAYVKMGNEDFRNS